MKNMYNVLYNTLQRIFTFLNAHSDKLGAILASDTYTQLQALSVTINTQGQLEASAKMTAKGETTNQTNLLVSLRKEHMDPIAQIARAKLRTVPQFSSLTMPKGHLSAANLAKYANAMADAAEPYAQVFIAGGQPADFIAQLRLTAAAIQASVNTRAQSLTSRAGAVNGLKDSDTKARELIKVASSLVEKNIGKDKQLLGEWRSAKRLSGKASNATSATPTSTPNAGPPTRSVTSTPPGSQTSAAASGTAAAAATTPPVTTSTSTSAPTTA